MGQRRKAIGLGLNHAEAAIAEFVSRITNDEPGADTRRTRLYSVGLTPGLIYALKNKRQRELSAAKLIAALAACEDLEVTVVGDADEGSVARRWVVRAEVADAPSPLDTTLGRNLVESRDSDCTKRVSMGTTTSEAIQLSLFAQLESAQSIEIEMRDVRFSRKESHRANIRFDLVLRQRVS